METTYQNDAFATSRVTSLTVASAAVRRSAPHAVSALRGELCPQGTGMRPRAMELGVGTGAGARWVAGMTAAVRVQHLISALTISVLDLTTDADVDAAVATDAAKRDITSTNGFAQHHPGSRTLRPPL